MTTPTPTLTEALIALANDEQDKAAAHDLRLAAFRITELQDEVVRLREREVILVDALHNVGIGGNHAALLIGSDHPLYVASQAEAEQHYGSNLDGLNAWFCWRSIMKAMREAYDTLPEDVRNAAWKRMEKRRARAAPDQQGERG